MFFWPSDPAFQQMVERKYRQLFFIDIAVPRNVDPRVGQMENVFVYDVERWRVGRRRVPSGASRGARVSSTRGPSRRVSRDVITRFAVM